MKNRHYISLIHIKGGDRTFTRYLGITDPELEVEKQSAIYVTIPSYAFALEVYSKTIVYCNTETTLTVLDLAKIPAGPALSFQWFSKAPWALLGNTTCWVQVC